MLVNELKGITDSDWKNSKDELPQNGSIIVATQNFTRFFLADVEKGEWQEHATQYPHSYDLRQVFYWRYLKCL